MRLERLSDLLRSIQLPRISLVMEQLKRTTAPYLFSVKKRNATAPGKVVQEQDVGVTQFVNDLSGKGFSGTIKQRYADFQVFEISLDGTVARLTDKGIQINCTKKDRRLEKREAECAQKSEPKKSDGSNKEVAAHKSATTDTAFITAEKDIETRPKNDLSETHRERLLQFVSAEELQGIEDLFSNGGNMETKTSFSEKSSRTQLHQLLREAFQGKLETVTSSKNTFRIALAKTDNRNRRNANANHVDDSGVLNYGLGQYKNYLHFTVYKENRETMEIASTITKFLRCPPKAVKFAGTKDRRGVTCQRFSLNKGHVARVNSLSKGLNGAVLGQFAYSDRGLDLGDLKGNEFLIAIRDVTPDVGGKLEDLVQQSFESLRMKGFINYYGLQRFGTFSISTHVLGIFILREDWTGAAELVLAEQDRILPESVEARRVWATLKDAAAAAKIMPRRCLAEYNILTQLAKEKKIDGSYSSNSYFKAIMQIPRNLRLIYVHAYQSYIWNLVVSRRFELFGLEVQEGDLVMVEEKCAEGRIVTDIVDGEEFAEDVASNYDKVRPLTAEDLALGMYTIYDVVLPSPGFDVIYPTNPKLMEVYESVMSRDGLDPHKMTRRVKEFLLAGLYRPIMQKPTDLSYNIVKYNDHVDPLLRTDLEILNEKLDSGQELLRVVQSVEDGQRTAVILKMRLGVSSYATMALREFMKTDTSRFSPSFDVKLTSETKLSSEEKPAPEKSIN